MLAPTCFGRAQAHACARPDSLRPGRPATAGTRGARPLAYFFERQQGDGLDTPEHLRRGQLGTHQAQREQTAAEHRAVALPGQNDPGPVDDRARADVAHLAGGGREPDAIALASQRRVVGRVCHGSAAVDLTDQQVERRARPRGAGGRVRRAVAVDAALKVVARDRSGLALAVLQQAVQLEAPVLDGSVGHVELGHPFDAVAARHDDGLAGCVGDHEPRCIGGGHDGPPWIAVDEHRGKRPDEGRSRHRLLGRRAVHLGEVIRIENLVARVGLRVAVGADEGDRLGRRKRRTAQRVLHDVGDLDAAHRLGTVDDVAAVHEPGEAVEGTRAERLEIGQRVLLDEAALVTDLQHDTGRRRRPGRGRRAEGDRLAGRAGRDRADEDDRRRQQRRDDPYDDPVSAHSHGSPLLTRWSRDRAAARIGSGPAPPRCDCLEDQLDLDELEH